MTAPPKLLVIIRLGSDHRVSSWAKIPKTKRDWDLLISPYDIIDDIDDFPADYIVPIKGGKWDAVFRIFEQNPDLLTKYDYFWLPDDDIEAEVSCPSDLLEIAVENDLQLLQPALTVNSQYSHLITIRNRFTRFRYTNFVELMAPMMSAEVLRASLPFMKGRWAAHGLDYFWQSFVPVKDNRKVAIIDDIQVGHYRETGKHLESRRLCPERGERTETKSLFEHEASRNYCPLSLSTSRVTIRLCVTALSFANIMFSPQLWRKANLGRILTHLGGQLFLSDWQGTR